MRIEIQTGYTMNRIKHRRIWWIAPLLLPVLITVSPLHVAAQEHIQMVRTLVIRDNQVLIDGREVARNHMPANLALDGISFSYSFIGVEMPVVTIGDQLFAIQKDRLQSIESRDQYRAVLSHQKSMERAVRQAKGWIVDSDRGEYYTFQGERLEANEAVPRLLSEANALYLEDLQKQNISLFAKLSSERELELEAEFLSIAARQARSKEDRDKHVRDLKEKLNVIFELKQQNRRDEITQFKAQLEQLRHRVERRDELKQKIIKDRVARLTGTRQ